jgi:hypothetical protein
MFVPLGGICFFLSLFVDDVGLPEDKVETANIVPDNGAGDVDTDHSSTNSDIPGAIPKREKGEGPR